MTSANIKSNSEIPKKGFELRETSNRIIKLKKELNIKVIEPFTSDIIEFDNIEQFNDYINRDLEKYTSLTTQKLNKMFHVPGYRITKINKEIGLRKVDTSKGCLSHEVANSLNPVNKDSISLLKNMVETLINEVSRIDNEVNTLKSYIK